jgi:hypothetical protein
MSLESKALLVMMPICLVAMVYALTQGNWRGAGTLAFIEVLMLFGYRAEKRNQAASMPDRRIEG